jgi:lactate dehydrogenase-like 2-hydroxyacid dehydrogenase
MCGGGLVGAKVGIVGLGSIGLAVAKRLLPFDIAKIMYCGRQEKPEGMNSFSNSSKSGENIKIRFLPISI